MMNHLYNGVLKYYLDTNAVRALAPRLDECKEIGAFISVWTICEMIGHLIKNPEDFRKIRENFRAITDSRISVVTKMPDELHYGAFSLELLVPVGSKSLDLRKMALLTLDVETYDEWVKKISEYSLLGTYKFVKEIDNATPRINQNIEKQYDTNISPQESQKKYEEFVLTEDKEVTHQRLLEYYVDGFIEKHEDVRMMGVMLKMSYEEFKQFLCNAYDGSIDLAFRVNACVVDKKVSLRQKLKRNDDTDMMHLYYVQNEIILVTDDRALRENVVAQYPERAISVQTFKCILNKHQRTPE